MFRTQDHQEIIVARLQARDRCRAGRQSLRHGPAPGRPYISSRVFLDVWIGLSEAETFEYGIGATLERRLRTQIGANPDLKQATPHSDLRPCRSHLCFEMVGVSSVPGRGERQTSKT